MAQDSSSEKTVKKASVTKKTSRRAPAAKKKPAAKKPTRSTKAAATAEPTPTRKAPTSATAVTTQKPFPKVLVGSLVSFVLIVGIAVAFGIADSGTIDVVEIVKEQKRVDTENGAGLLDNVPVPAQNVVARVPNGGLRPSSDQSTSEPPVVSTTTASTTATSTASSTEEVATSTETATAATVEENETAPVSTETTPEPDQGDVPTE